MINRDAILLSLVVGPVYASGRASETPFRGICYALIALPVIFGLPPLDSVLR